MPRWNSSTCSVCGGPSEGNTCRGCRAIRDAEVQRRYRSSRKGRARVRVSVKAYYHQHRDEILRRKRMKARGLHA